MRYDHMLPKWIYMLFDLKFNTKNNKKIKVHGCAASV